MRRPSFALLACGLWALAAVVGGAPCFGQQPGDWDPQRVASRASLQDLMGRLQQVSRSPAYSSRLRAQAVDEVALIRGRLADGDFRVGDRILLQVEGEQALTDTFTVGSGRAISLPMLGTVSLSGVLRSELEPHMRDEVKKYLRQPVVHAHSLMPITIVGEVGRPGFFTVPNEVPIATALMSAGGPTREANLSSIEIERDGRPIWSGRELQQAISDGKTLEQLNLRPGDRLVVGRARSANVESLLRMVTLLITIPSAVYAISHL